MSILRTKGHDSHFPHEMCFEFLCFMTALTVFFIFLFYEMIWIGAPPAGTELLGNKYHIQILYSALLFLVLALHRDIFAAAIEKPSGAELVLQLIPGLITHPALFLCYILYIFFLPTHFLYNDFKSRGSIIVIVISGIMLIKEIMRTFPALVGGIRTNKDRSLFGKISIILFLSGFVASVFIFITGPLFLYMHASVMGLFFLLLYITWRTSALKKTWISYHSLEEKKEKDKTYKSSSGKIRLITEFIDQNYREGITREDIAEAVKMSSEHLSRIFKASTGKTIVDYINEIRINKAAEMIAGTNKTIIEIAFSSGFNSLRTFNRVFAKYTGMNPLHYRNLKRTGTPAL